MKEPKCVHEHAEIKEIVRLGSVKNLDMQDFVEELTMVNSNTAQYIDTFYTILLGTTYQYNPQSNTSLFLVPAIYYSTGEYHKYILIRPSDFKYEMKDKVSELKPNTHLVKVTKLEPYERDSLYNHILESVNRITQQKINMVRKKWMQQY